jgi:hypothetical protein
MKSTLVFSVLAAVLCFVAPNANAASNDSTYTNLSGRECKLLNAQREGANSTQRCPGVGGFRVLVLDSDGRQSIALVSAEGQKFELNFWEIVTRNFSTLGNKAEWRVARNGVQIRPLALIVRVNASEDPDSSQPTSYLTVTKITRDEICVVAKIAPSATASQEARRVADVAAEKSCLGPAS